MEQVLSSGFGQLLRRYRLAAGLTQEELAERARLSVRTISDLERGVNLSPRKDTLPLLVAALGLSPEESVRLEASARRLKGALPTLPASFGPRLVGRRRELELLEGHLMGEGPPVLLLAGEPGIGKSRLLAEAGHRAARDGWSVLAGGCQRRGGQEPYAPILEALERHIQAQSAARRHSDLDGCAWLVRLLPELAESELVHVHAWTLPAEQERRLIFKAVARFLSNVSGPAGTLLLLDDMQWAGADALDLLAALARAAAESCLRVLVAYRDTEVGPQAPLGLLLADLAHAGLIAHHTLAPLASEEAALLLDDLLEGAATDREEVLRRTGGVPFFLVNCAQALQAGTIDDDVTVPWTVAQGVRQRVALLPSTAREVVSAAAVVGRVVPRPLLVAVATRPEAEVIAALEAACRARLLEDAGNDAYQFAHDVIHEVVRAGLTAALRVALHRRVAETLERLPGEPSSELLAYHFAQAEEHERAIVYLVQAAEHARQAAASREAVTLLAQAIALAERLRQPVRVAELRALRGKAFLSAELWTEARAELDAALAGLEPERHERRAAILVDLAQTCWWALDGMASRGYATAALEQADLAGHDGLAAAALVSMAQADKIEGQMWQSLELYNRSIARAAGACVPELESVPLAYYLVGQVDEGIRWGRELIPAIRGSKNAAATANALANTGLVLAAGGCYDEALRSFEEAQRLGRDYEIWTMLARAMACSTGLHVDLFDYVGAEARALEAHDMARSANWLPTMVSAGIDLLMIYVRRGAVGRADALVDEVVRLSKLPGSFHDWQWAIRLTEVRAEIALAHGDWEQTRRWIDQSLKQCRISGRVKYEAIGLGTLARAAVAQGCVKEAIADLRQAVALTRKVGDPAQILRLGAMLLELDGDDDLAAEVRTAAARIAAGLTDETLCRRFRESEVVRGLGPQALMRL